MKTSQLGNPIFAKAMKDGYFFESDSSNYYFKSFDQKEIFRYPFETYTEDGAFIAFNVDRKEIERKKNEKKYEKIRIEDEKDNLVKNFHNGLISREYFIANYSILDPSHSDVERFANVIERQRGSLKNILRKKQLKLEEITDKNKLKYHVFSLFYNQEITKQDYIERLAPLLEATLYLSPKQALIMAQEDADNFESLSSIEKENQFTFRESLRALISLSIFTDSKNPTSAIVDQQDEKIEYQCT